MDLQFVRVASLTGYVPLVKALAGDPDALLNLAHIEPRLLQGADHLIPAQSLCDLLEISAEQLSCPDFGLQLSQQQGLSMLGAVGLVMRQADTLGEALQLLRRYLHIHSQAGSMDIAPHNGLVQLSYTPHYDYRGRNRQLIDLTMGVGLNILTLFAGPQVRAKAVHFSYQAPEQLQRYHQLFRAPLMFNSEANSVLLDQKMLELPVASDTPELKTFIDQYLNELERAAPTQLEQKVELVIRQLIHTGECNLNSTANLLDVHPRTLQRRLANRGVSFQQLLDQVRKQIAVRYLQESEFSITQLSELLGYAESTVFSRAFRTWVGVSPSQFILRQGKRLRIRQKT